MARHSCWKWIARTTGLGTIAAGAAFLVACGADHAAPADIGGGGSNEGGWGNDIHLPPLPATGDCRTGAVQDCSQYYKSGGVTSCFVGVQLCVEGQWDICTTQEKVDEKIAELGYDEPTGAAGGGGVGGAGG